MLLTASPFGYLNLLLQLINFVINYPTPSADVLPSCILKFPGIHLQIYRLFHAGHH